MLTQFFQFKDVNFVHFFQKKKYYTSFIKFNTKISGKYVRKIKILNVSPKIGDFTLYIEQKWMTPKKHKTVFFYQNQKKKKNNNK